MTANVTTVPTNAEMPTMSATLMLRSRAISGPARLNACVSKRWKNDVKPMTNRGTIPYFERLTRAKSSEARTMDRTDIEVSLSVSASPGRSVPLVPPARST